MAISALRATSPQPTKENRREPRISHALKMCVQGIEMSSSNVSVNGAQLCCPIMRYEGLLAARQNETISVSWHIPAAEEAFNAAAALRYANVCDDEILLGIEFVEFVTGDREAWRGYIERLISQRRA